MIHLVRVFLVLVMFLSPFFGVGQNVIAEFDSKSIRYDKPLRFSKNNNYEIIRIADSNYFVPNYSASLNQKDTLLLTFRSDEEIDIRRVQFFLNDSLVQLEIRQISNNSLRVILPKFESNYSLIVHFDDQVVGKLNVIVLTPQKHQLIVVPLMDIDVQPDSLQVFLNEIYRVSETEFQVQVRFPFHPENFTDTVMTNPSLAHDRFTDQMIELRNNFFERYPETTKEAYYVFIVPRFTNPKVKGYMVKNKAVAFIANEAGRVSYYEIAHQLGYGIGGLDDVEAQEDSLNLMASLGGVRLNARQWALIQRNGPSTSFYDDYEDVKTNSGLIAYYFWKENEDGTIDLVDGSVLKAIKRPYKENQPSLHRNIDNFFFKPLFRIGGTAINALHIIAVGIILLILWLLRRKVFFRLVDNATNRKFLRFLVRVFLVGFAFASFLLSFILINYGYRMFDIESGIIKHLHGRSMSSVIRIVQAKRSPKEYTGATASEVLIQKGDQWEVQKKKKVLYFDVKKNEDGEETCVFSKDNDLLLLPSMNYSSEAKSHYMVLRYFDEKDQLTSEKVFNHIGQEVTDKIGLDDPIKRILVFVNGYRPTSLGSTFEENFNDIRKNGLEFPNSRNQLYQFDRYEYWNPWNKIDTRFKERINPGETYYADGHFSVATSNHRSLFNFTTTSSVYPKRCENLAKHTCKKSVSFWEMFGLATQYNTYELHRTTPNMRGFNIRRNNGRIAGRNLYQMLNELPNRSENDTLFIVAHSMGYAYSLGLLDELEGKINFGEYYIIAPENASAGTVNMSEWNKVWQYGEDYERHKFLAPCLMDGIAPQTKVGGLSENNRAFIPEKYYRRMGFYDSHFIGYYTWIFDLKSDETGYIQQR